MAKLICGDAKPIIDELAAPKLAELIAYCGWLMFLSEQARRCWRMAPFTYDEDADARMTCMRFKKHGLKLQLDHVGDDYVLNKARGPIRRPPRVNRPRPQTQNARAPKRTAAQPPAQPERGKRGPRKTDKTGKGDKRIIELWKTARLPEPLNDGRRIVAALLSSIYVRLTRMKDDGLATIRRILTRLSASRAHAETFVQHARRALARIHRLVISNADFEPHTEAAGLRRLETRWFGREFGMNILLSCYADETVSESEWQSFLFGKPAAESELVLT